MWNFICMCIVIKHSGSIPRNACVACETQLCVTTKKMWLPDRQTDKQTPDKVILMCRYASQGTQKNPIWMKDFDFRIMHMSPAKHIYAWLPRKCDCRTDRWTDGQTEAGQSDPYVPLCFAGDTKNAWVKDSYAWPQRKCDYRTDRRTDRQTDGKTDTGQSDPYVPLCFAGDTKSAYLNKR